MEKDFDGTLAKRMAAIGITTVEFAGFFGRTASRYVLVCRGLTRATGAHCIAAERFAG